MMATQSALAGIQSTAGAIPVKNDKGKYFTMFIDFVSEVWFIDLNPLTRLNYYKIQVI